MGFNVAIDGPSGAGKSSLSKAVAARLGYIYVDTGALYRAIGFYAVGNGISTTDAKGVGEALKDIKVELKYVNGTQRVFLNGSDVSGFIRTQQISMAASNVSAIPSVREFLLDTQRDIAKKNNVIMDGRDVGTVILPDADVKIFLTASPEKRAERRFLELKEKGILNGTDYETILKEVIERDRNDSTRTIAPLKQADDAVLLDNSDMTLEETIDEVVRLIESGTKNAL